MLPASLALGMGMMPMEWAHQCQLFQKMWRHSAQELLQEGAASAASWSLLLLLGCQQRLGSPGGALLLREWHQE